MLENLPILPSYTSFWARFSIVGFGLSDGHFNFQTLKLAFLFIKNGWYFIGKISVFSLRNSVDFWSIPRQFCITNLNDSVLFEKQKSPSFFFNFSFRSQILSTLQSFNLTFYTPLWKLGPYFPVAKTIQVQAGFEHFASGITQAFQHQLSAVLESVTWHSQRMLSPIHKAEMGLREMITNRSVLGHWEWLPVEANLLPSSFWD